MGLKSKLLRLLGRGKKSKKTVAGAVKTPAHVAASRQCASPSVVFTGFKPKTPGSALRPGDSASLFSPGPGVQKRLSFTGNVALLALATPSATRTARSAVEEDTDPTTEHTSARSAAAEGGGGDAVAGEEASASQRSVGSARSVSSSASGASGPASARKPKKRLSVSFRLDSLHTAPDAPAPPSPGPGPDPPPPPPLAGPAPPPDAAPQPAPAPLPAPSPARAGRPLPPPPTPVPAHKLPPVEPSTPVPAAAPPPTPSRPAAIPPPPRPVGSPEPAAATAVTPRAQGGASSSAAGAARIVGRAEWAERVVAELAEAERRFEELRGQLQGEGKLPAAPAPAQRRPSDGAGHGSPEEVAGGGGARQLPASPLISISGTARNLPVKRQAELKRMIQSLIRCYVAADRELAAALQLASPEHPAAPAPRPSDAFAALDALASRPSDGRRGGEGEGEAAPGAPPGGEAPAPETCGEGPSRVERRRAAPAPGSASASGSASGAGRDSAGPGPKTSQELLASLLAARSRARRSAGRAKAALRASCAAAPSGRPGPSPRGRPASATAEEAPAAGGRPASAPRSRPQAPLRSSRDALLEIPLNSGVGRRIFDPTAAVAAAASGGKGPRAPQPSVSALLHD